MPRFVIPADRKWYRNWEAIRILIEALEEMAPQYPKGERPTSPSSDVDVGFPAMADGDDFASRIAAAYASDGPTLELGRAMLGGRTFPEAVVGVPAAMCNRHGLIAGATGTGKIKTLHLMAEQGHGDDPLRAGGAHTGGVDQDAAAQSLMAAIEAGEVDRLARESPLWKRYGTEIDRESAREMLAARTAAGSVAAESAPATAEAGAPAPRPQPKGKKTDENAVVSYIKSREGRSMMNTVARGVFGLLKKRR